MGNLTKKEYNKAKFGWTKYGCTKVEVVEDDGNWTCQTCGETQPNEFPHYFVPLDSNRYEFLKICSICKHIQLEHKLKKYDYITIINIVRRY